MRLKLRGPFGMRLSFFPGCRNHGIVEPGIFWYNGSTARYGYRSAPQAVRVSRRAGISTLWTLIFSRLHMAAASPAA